MRVTGDRAALNAEIAALGTNLLTVQPGQNFTGGTAELPAARACSSGRGGGWAASAARRRSACAARRERRCCSPGGSTCPPSPKHR
jgi:hypothetical protein